MLDAKASAHRCDGRQLGQHLTINLEPLNRKIVLLDTEQSTCTLYVVDREILQALLMKPFYVLWLNGETRRMKIGSNMQMREQRSNTTWSSVTF